MSKWNLKDNNIYELKYWNLVSDELSHIEYEDIIHYDTVKILKIDDIEAELLLDGNFIKKHQCNCAHWAIKEPCEHILCMVSLIRAKKIIIKEVHFSNDNVRSHKRLDLKNILNDISTDELISFIRDYAKKNSNFNHHMMTHFAYKLSSVDNDDKFESLFFKILNQPKDKFNYFTPSSVRQLNKLFITFGEQLKILCSLNDYQQVYSLLKISIFNFNKSLPNIKKEYLEQVFSNFQKLLENFHFDKSLTLSPTLIDLYQIEFIDWIKKRTFINKGLSIKLIYILISLNSKEILVQLIQVLLNDILSIDNLNYKESYGAQLLIVSYINDNSDNSIHFHCKTMEKSSKIAMDYLIDNNYYPSAMSLLKSLENTGINIDDQLLKIHILENDKPNIIKLSKSIFEKTLNTKYLEILDRVMTKSNFNKWKSQFIEKLQEDENWEKIIEIHVVLNEIDELKSFLFHQADVNLWIDHIPKVKQYFLENDYLLLSNFIIEFLNNHLGKKASDKIKALLNKLKTANNEKNIQKINDMILEKYLDRPSITKMNEINFKIDI